MYGDFFYGGKGLLWPATFVCYVCIPTKAYTMKIVMYSVMICIKFAYSEGYDAYMMVFCDKYGPS